MIAAAVTLSATVFGADEPGLETLTEVAVRELKVQNQVHHKTWGMGKAVDVEIDQDAGKIFWTFADGHVVEAPVQIVGTYAPQTGSFLWAWANHTILRALHPGATRLRAYGEAHGIELFTSRSIRISRSKAWELTALANHLAQTSGAYRSGAGGVIVYFTFGKVSLKAANASD